MITRGNGGLHEVNIVGIEYSITLAVPDRKEGHLGAQLFEDGSVHETDNIPGDLHPGSQLVRPL